jgi:hypothetical protein
MAVEIINNMKKESLEVLYHFEEEKLTSFSSTMYIFPKIINSKIFFLEKNYVPTRIHICEKLHRITGYNPECEMVLECEYISATPKKLFLCIGIQFNHGSDVVFPLETINYEKIVGKCTKNLFYQTRSGNNVFLCRDLLNVKGEKPKLTVSAHNAYKEIINYDSYDSLKAVLVLSDGQTQKIEPKTFDVKLTKMLYINSTQEGFIGTIGKDDTYMECKLLQEDANDPNQVYEDVAVVPLKTNTYERGMVTFSHFLHFFLVSVGAGLGFPNLMVTIFDKKTFINEETGKPKTFLRILIGFFSIVCFFLVGLIMVIIGLADPRYSSKIANDQTIKQGSVLATVGFYMILVHCSFALGMFTFKKFGALVSKRFDDMFEKDELSGSFWDILDGLKNV